MECNKDSGLQIICRPQIHSLCGAPAPLYVPGALKAPGVQETLSGKLQSPGMQIHFLYVDYEGYLFGICKKSGEMNP